MSKQKSSVASAEREQAEQAQRSMDELFQALIENASDVITISDTEGAIRYESPSVEQVLGYKPAELIGVNIVELLHPEDVPKMNAAIKAIAPQNGTPGIAQALEVRLRHKDGSWRMMEGIGKVLVTSSVTGVVVNYRDITERKRSEQEIESLSRFPAENPNPILRVKYDGQVMYANPASTPLMGLWNCTVGGYVPPDWRDRIVIASGNGERTTVEVDCEGVVYSVLIAPIPDPGYVNLYARDVTERNQAEAQILRQVETLGILYTISRELAEMEDFDAILELLTRQAVEATHVTFSHVLLLEDGDLVARAVFPVRPLDHNLQVGQREPLAAHPFCQRILEENIPRVLQADSPEAGDCAPFFLGIAQTICVVPLRTRERPLGLLILGEVRAAEREPFTEEKVDLARSIGDQASSTLHRALLYEATGRQVDQLQALQNIDQAIGGSFDLHLTLSVILQQATTQLQVDAADVLLLDPHLQTLEYVAGRGFRGRAVERNRVRLGEGEAGRAALERRTIQHPDFAASGVVFVHAELLAGENVAAYFAVPLIAKGEVKGVLEIFHRSPMKPDSGWLNFLETLAGQAAIAMDNARLFDNLQRSNVDLAQAYDATIEGWSRALDLRDKETEGHTLRVTQLAERLARAAGVGEVELVHVRRGALLHDIGKMGVPDAILLKPGKLTDEEWVIMRKHPQFAYDMLSPIAYLKPALDIPCNHHEKWDGTGYPRGLKGEQIPLAARLFAIVDVWDALRSDRPYRNAWPVEKVLEHVKAGSGTHFDPKAVELFLKVISEEAHEHG